MDPSEREERTARIKSAIERAAFVRADDATIATTQGKLNEKGWIFDIRNIILTAEVLDDAAALFWDAFRDISPQIGCLESGGIPLATAFVVDAKRYGGHDGQTGFFIRKSRKKTGLMKMVEGTIVPDQPIVLVDDLLNSGKSFMRQIEVVESLGQRVAAVWVLVRFRDESYYEYFHKKGIAVRALFELNDFADALKTKNLTSREKPPHVQPFRVLWKFSSPEPSYMHVVPKSELLLDQQRLYVGSDSGVFWALNQADGSVAWSYKVGFHPKGKGIFSSPALFENVVVFGAYDGNVYGLDAATGKKKWIFFEADWIGSSPAVAADLGIIYVGLEFGLWKKRGGIAALDAKTGKKIWHFPMPCFTHSSPLYMQEHQQVVIGSNDGAAYLFDARTGTLQWKFETGPLSEAAIDSGFSENDIKESFAYDAKRDLIVFGNMNGIVFFVDRKTGQVRGTFNAEFGFYSTPVIHADTVFVSSLDKYLYCIDLNTFELRWKWYGGARIFATPVIIDGSIYIGANTGRLTELDPATGKERSSLTITERITNKIAYNPETERFFLPSFANEIYCLERDH